MAALAASDGNRPVAALAKRELNARKLAPKVCLGPLGEASVTGDARQFDVAKCVLDRWGPRL